MVGVAVDPHATRHHAPTPVDPFAAAAPLGPRAGGLSVAAPGVPLLRRQRGLGEELEPVRRERSAGDGQGLDGRERRMLGGTSTIQASGTPSASRLRWKRAVSARSLQIRSGVGARSSDQAASAPAASPMFHSTGCSR